MNKITDNLRSYVRTIHTSLTEGAAQAYTHLKAGEVDVYVDMSQCLQKDAAFLQVFDAVLKSLEPELGPLSQTIRVKDAITDVQATINRQAANPTLQPFKLQAYARVLQILQGKE